MEKFIKKLTSRKFLVGIIGVISGIVLVACGNEGEGMTTIVASVIAYLAAEGLVDAAAVSKKTEEIIEDVEKAKDGGTK